MIRLLGIVRGKVIELAEDVGLPDGEQVEIQVISKRKRAPGEGLRQCAGALAEDWSAIDDQILAEIEKDRVNAAHRALPE